MLDFGTDGRNIVPLGAAFGGQPTSIREVPPGQLYHLQWHRLRVQGGRPGSAQAVPGDDRSSHRRGGHAGDPACVVIGCFVGLHLRGAAELREFVPGRQRNAQIVLTVETAWQGQGMGTALMALAVRVARERGIGHLYLTCHALNHRPQRIAERFGARSGFEGCEYFAEIAVQNVT